MGCRVGAVSSHMLHFLVGVSQVWGFASINRIYESIAQSNLFWLTVLQKVFSSLQGLLNAIAYGASASIRTALIKEFPFLRRICPG